MERLNRELTDELCIVEAYIPKSGFAEIEYAAYDFEICTAGASEKMASEIEKTLTTSPLNLVKRTKSGEKEIDIVPLINEAKVSFDSDRGTIKISVVLSASSTSFLNPEMLITAMKQKNGILAGSLSDEWSCDF